MKDVSLYELLKSGAHFGHKTSRWNPKMKPFIYTVRNDIHIFDLEKTRKAILKAADFLAKTAQNGGNILFVGTKRQLRNIVRAKAEMAAVPFVNVRWLGGTFTNFKTIQKTIRKMEKLQELSESPDFLTRYTKKERLLMQRDLSKMMKLFAGVKDLKRIPEVIFIADVHHDDIAVKEAQKSKVKIVGIVDSNTSPEGVDYVIPCNDDAAGAVELVSEVLADAIITGRGQRAKSETANEAPKK